MSERIRGRLSLESGQSYEGWLFGAVPESPRSGEIVFNTCMTGYQEVASDPSYAGQIVVMTYPLIGNYGCRDTTRESARIHCSGLVVRELSPTVGHPAAQRSLTDELEAFGVPGLAGVDTRALTRHLRSRGTLRGIVAAADSVSAETQVEMARSAPSISELDLVAAVSEGTVPRDWEGVLPPALWRSDSAASGTGLTIVVVDMGAKYNQLRALRSRGARVVLVPHTSSLDAILALQPDGVVLSNGPGDPERLPHQVQLCRELLSRRLPLLGICLGHQVMAQAIGASTARLHFGHHGGNHPVKNLSTGEVYVTSQNHEFHVVAESIPAGSGWIVSEVSLNDGSVEGLRHRELPAFSVQYHPEGAPGPQDRAQVFDEFLSMAAGKRTAPSGLVAADQPEAASSRMAVPPRSVLVIGSGPVVIGQAAEFDYAGTQACRALREEGIRVILVNSNPATIMTDDGTADTVYIEPLTVEVLSRIIEAERPDGLLATLGGQTALNLALELSQTGVLERFNVALLGSSMHAIRTAEDRQAFKQMMQTIGEPTAESETVTTLIAAQQFRLKVGLPLVVRPAFTLGGTGGGLCHSDEEFVERVSAGISASPIGQVLVERSLEGWRELEYEIVRDAVGTCITVCNMENLDPMGVHTGDSIVVAPSQTLTDAEHQQLRSAARRIVDSLDIAGGCNVQFALAPDSHEYYVVEVNPRVSRSSALASKATGFPIARVAAKIAAGKRLDEIPNAVTGRTCAAFEPALDYCVVKIPRWPFDKFPQGDRRLGTQMKATGEVMAIERSFPAALNKALRSLEQTLPQPAELHSGQWLDQATDLRLLGVMQALRDGMPTDRVAQRCGYMRWFVDQIRLLVECEQRLRWNGLSDEGLIAAKRLAFTDQQISHLSGTDQRSVRERRESLGLHVSYKCVDTCAAEFEASTPYYYSTTEAESEAAGGNERAVVVVGSGPIRIGQGIEFDYCSVQAAQALRARGVAAIMINSNPETVSTDFDCSTRLYFEPLDFEACSEVVAAERAEGVVLQFGGQTAINLAAPLSAAGIAVLGTGAAVIHAAEDRRSFEALMSSLGIPQPHGAATTDAAEAVAIARRVGYPVLVRPSYVLGGHAMEVVHSEQALMRYLDRALEAAGDGSGASGTLLVDRYLVGTEVDVDAISDGTDVVIPGLMEHVERAGVHSGDSMAAYPPPNLGQQLIEEITAATVRIARQLPVRGLCNIQFVVFGGRAHVIEVNPRASRTVPFLSKISGVAMVELATRIMLGEKLSQMGWTTGLVAPRDLVAVKAPVFSTSKLAAVDTALGPEMKSTGEVMGIDIDLGAALEKAFVAALDQVPKNGGVLCSIADSDKQEALPILRLLVELGFTLLATGGTAAALAVAGVPALTVGKIGHSRPTVLDVIEQGRVNMVINTVSHLDSAEESGADSVHTVKDGYRIRRAAEQGHIPCCTSLDTARALVDVIGRRQRGEAVRVSPVRWYRDRVASAAV